MAFVLYVKRVCVYPLSQPSRRDYPLQVLHEADWCGSSESDVHQTPLFLPSQLQNGEIH